MSVILQEPEVGRVVVFVSDHVLRVERFCFQVASAYFFCGSGYGVLAFLSSFGFFYSPVPRFEDH